MSPSIYITYLIISELLIIFTEFSTDGLCNI